MTFVPSIIVQIRKETLFTVYQVVNFHMVFIPFTCLYVPLTPMCLKYNLQLGLSTQHTSLLLSSPFLCVHKVQVFHSLQTKLTTTKTSSS